MSAALIVQLITTFGPGAVTLIDGLIEKWHNKADVTPAEWAALSAALRVSARDHMAARLTAAGIALDSEAAKSLLALT